MTVGVTRRQTRFIEDRRCRRPARRPTAPHFSTDAPRLAAVLLATVWTLLGTVALPAHAAAATGWIRLAHLSPDTPAVDVYLYPYGDHAAQLVLKHVGYGTASPYQPVKPGIYTVAMRGADADPASAPVISTNVTVAAGVLHTVAGLGQHSALTLTVLTDQSAPPPGKAGVRLIEASLRNPAVTVTAGQSTLATGLRFPAATDYLPVTPGTMTVTVTAPTGPTSRQLAVAAASTHTLAILDDPTGALQILDLTDAVGMAAPPSGSARVGLGGTATANPDRTGMSPVSIALDAALILAGAATTLFGVKRLRNG